MVRAFLNLAIQGEVLGQGFDNFLEWCVDAVGVKGKSVEGHFRHTSLTIEEV